MMSKNSNRISGVLVALFVVGSAGVAFAQSANGGGGGRGGDGGTSGGGATMMPATYLAVVPNNTSRQPQQPPQRGRIGHLDGSGCPTPTEGIRGPHLMGPCGPY